MYSHPSPCKDGKIRKILSLALAAAVVMISLPVSVTRALAKECIFQASYFLTRTPDVLSIQSSSTGLVQDPGMPAFPPRPPRIIPVRTPTVEERKARADHLEVNPGGDVQIQAGEYKLFTAIPRDRDGEIVHGVPAQWSSSDPQIIAIQENGEAKAKKAGKAQLTAMVGAKSASVNVTITPPPPSVASLDKGKPAFSSHSGRKSKLSGRLARLFRSGLSNSNALGGNAHAALPMMPQGGEGKTLSTVDGVNAVGAPAGKRTLGAPVNSPATGGTETPGSSNFSFNIPLAGIPGRGLSAGLSLYYNSRVWNNWNDGTNTHIDFNLDAGWPGPGFTLGYGKVQFPLDGGVTLIDPDGTRHFMAGSGQWSSDDGSFINMGYNQDGSYTVMRADGSQTLYAAHDSNGTCYPVKITDRNGNYMLINYLTGVGPQISSIQDTLLRTIKFYYYQSTSPNGQHNWDLVAITVPGFNGGSEQQVANFYYDDFQIGNGTLNDFAPNIQTNAPTGTWYHILDHVYLPNSSDGAGGYSGYRFGYKDGGGGAAYGEISTVTHQVGMTINPVVIQNGLVTTRGNITGEGTMLAYSFYNYPTAPLGLSDVPNFTIRRDDWAGRISAQPTYTFNSPTPPAGVSTVLAPDNTVTETHTNVHPGFPDDGLLTEVKISNGGTVYSDAVYTWETINWENPRIKQVQTSNDAATGDPLKTRITSYEYDATTDCLDRGFTWIPCNNVSKLHELDFAGTEVRRTETTYATTSSYAGRQLIHLPLTVKVYGNGLANAQSEVDYAYDQSALASEPVLYGWADPGTTYRGNLTTVTRHTNTLGPGTDTTIPRAMTYDVAGNLISEQVDCCTLKTYSYGYVNYSAYLTFQTRGSGPQLNSSADYDFNTGLVLDSVGENGQMSYYYYYSNTHRISSVWYPDGGNTQYNYSDALQADADGSLHYLADVVTQLNSTQSTAYYNFYDGRGAVTRSFSGYTSTNGWATRDTQFDLMGRPYRTSNPYYSGGYGSAINPTGLWTTVSTFDALGRATLVTMPDGTTAQTSYSGVYTTGTDQAGKQRRQVRDWGGRVIRVDEPDGNGNLGGTTSPNQATSYAYDAMDHVIQVTQGAQNRYFRYDSMGRLSYERQVEQAAPYTNFTDPLTTNGSWSRQYGYDSNSFLTTVGDANNFTTNYTPDGLNRISSITYHDNKTPNVTFTYDTGRSGFYDSGLVTQVQTAAYNGAPQVTTQFDYDKMGRVLSQTEQIGATSYPVSYTYNLAGELLNETYPSGRVMKNAYDGAGRLSSLTDALSNTYDSGFGYEASGALNSETFGNGAVNARSYNNRLQTSQIKLTLSGAVQQQYDYGYGTFNSSTGAVDATKNNGQIGSIKSTIGTALQWLQGFSYDSIGRLSNVAEYKQGSMNLETYQQAYTYDRYANRFQSANATLGLPAVSTGDIDASTNRFTTGAATHDGDGNVTSDLKFRGMNYVYDWNGRQTKTSSTSDGSDSSTSVYDGAGQRVQTTIYTYSRQMVYDAFAQLIADYGSGLEREYIYRGGQLLAINEGTGSAINLSQGKTATQSSTYSQNGITFSANLAVDGSTDGTFWDVHLSATNIESQPWWQVDLGTDGQINTVEVWPRTDCCPEQTANFYVLVSDTPFTSNVLSDLLGQPAVVSAYYVSGDASTPTNVAVNRTGRYVRVQRSDYQYLILAEVQAWGPGTSAALKYVLRDEKGSTRMVMQGTSVVSRHDFLPFGEEIWSDIGQRNTTPGYGAPDWVRPLYGSMERDEATGLDHTPWRKYESYGGRWTGPDPYTGSMSIGDPQSLNRYAYVGNDPSNGTDSTGLGDDNGWFLSHGFDASEQVSFNSSSPRPRPITENEQWFYGSDIMRTEEALYYQRVGNAIGGFGFLTSGQVIRNLSFDIYYIQYSDGSLDTWFNILVWGNGGGDNGIADPNTAFYGGLNPLFHPLPWRGPNISPGTKGPEFPTFGPQEPAPPPPGWEPGVKLGGPKGLEETWNYNPDLMNRNKFDRAALKVLQILSAISSPGLDLIMVFNLPYYEMLRQRKALDESPGP